MIDANYLFIEATQEVSHNPDRDKASSKCKEYEPCRGVGTRRKNEVIAEQIHREATNWSKRKKKSRLEVLTVDRCVEGTDADCKNDATQ